MIIFRCALHYLTEFIFRILSNSVPVTVLQWDFTGELLLVADESGCVRIYRTKDHLLNEWQLALQTVLKGEHILCAAFFHSGKKVIGTFELVTCANHDPLYISILLAFNFF